MKFTQIFKMLKLLKGIRCDTVMEIIIKTEL